MLGRTTAAVIRHHSSLAVAPDVSLKINVPILAVVQFQVLAITDIAIRILSRLQLIFGTKAHLVNGMTTDIFPVIVPAIIFTSRVWKVCGDIRMAMIVLLLSGWIHSILATQLHTTTVLPVIQTIGCKVRAMMYFTHLNLRTQCLS